VAWLFALPEAKLLALDKGSHFARFRTAEAIRRGDAQRVQVTERMIICVTSIFLLLPGPHRRLVRAGLMESFNERQSNSIDGGEDAKSFDRDRRNIGNDRPIHHGLSPAKSADV